MAPAFRAPESAALESGDATNFRFARQALSILYRGSKVEDNIRGERLLDRCGLKSLKSLHKAVIFQQRHKRLESGLRMLFSEEFLACPRSASLTSPG
ncbi:MAG: hypothetical protein Fues2KO_13210 [Fuerstiella sp.]